MIRTVYLELLPPPLRSTKNIKDDRGGPIITGFFYWVWREGSVKHNNHYLYALYTHLPPHPHKNYLSTKLGDNT